MFTARCSVFFLLTGYCSLKALERQQISAKAAHNPLFIELDAKFLRIPHPTIVKELCQKKSTKKFWIQFQIWISIKIERFLLARHPTPEKKFHNNLPTFIYSVLQFL